MDVKALTVFFTKETVFDCSEVADVPLEFS